MLNRKLKLKLKFKRTTPTAKLPSQKYETDAGIDIYTDIAEPITIHPGDGHTFTTGIRSEIPPGYALLLWDRSSLGSSLIHRCAGVIDSDYRGEILITLANIGTNPRTILPGDKIIQGIITKIYTVDIRDVDTHPQENGTLTKTERDTKGFGHSGR